MDRTLIANTSIFDGTGAMPYAGDVAGRRRAHRRRAAGRGIAAR